MGKSELFHSDEEMDISEGRGSGISKLGNPRPLEEDPQDDRLSGDDTTSIESLSDKSDEGDTEEVSEVVQEEQQEEQESILLGIQEVWQPDLRVAIREIAQLVH